MVIPAGLAHADYQAGLNAYVDGDFETAMAEWKAEVNQPGEPANLAIYRESLYAIGMLYWQGEGVEQDYAIAAVWMKQAADINHPGAQNKLGYLYSTGQGVPQNFQEARRYFEMAARQGDPDAGHNLDQLFQQGLLAPGAAETASEAAPTPGVAPDKQAAATIERTVSAATAAAEEPAAPAGDSARDRGEDWIRAQNPEHYTIQVIALRSPERLREFVATHPGWAPFAIYRPAGNELPLNVLVQGVYASVEEAQAARDRFPPGLQTSGQMWIRKFRKVQEMIE